jgi:hypothetical protein
VAHLLPQDTDEIRIDREAFDADERREVWPSPMPDEQSFSFRVEPRIQTQAHVFQRHIAVEPISERLHNLPLERRRSKRNRRSNDGERDNKDRAEGYERPDPGPSVDHEIKKAETVPWRPAPPEF